MDTATRRRLDEYRGRLQVAKHRLKLCADTIERLELRAEAAEDVAGPLRDWLAAKRQWEAEELQCRIGIAELESACDHAASGFTELRCINCLQTGSQPDDDPTPVEHSHVHVCQGCGRREHRPVPRA